MHRELCVCAVGGRESDPGSQVAAEPGFHRLVPAGEATHTNAALCLVFLGPVKGRHLERSIQRPHHSA